MNTIVQDNFEYKNPIRNILNLDDKSEFSSNLGVTTIINSRGGAASWKLFL